MFPPESCRIRRPRPRGADVEALDHLFGVGHGLAAGEDRARTHRLSPVRLQDQVLRDRQVRRDAGAHPVLGHVSDPEVDGRTGISESEARLRRS